MSGFVELWARAWRGLIAAAPVRLWAMILAAPPLTGFAAWLVWIIWRGGWQGIEAQRMNILGWSLWMTIFLIGVIVIALAMVKVRAQLPGGTSVEVDGGPEGDPGADHPPAG